MLAPDFVEYGRSGRAYAREHILLDAEPGAPIEATLPLEEFSARLLADGVVQVTYISEVRRGQTLERARRSSIWSSIDGCWRLRFHQGTPLPD